MVNRKMLDIIIIGGSYAGISAATILGRSLREVLIIDGGRPRNKTTPTSNSFLTRDGVAPGKIIAIARDQLKKYHTVKMLQDIAVRVVKGPDKFTVITKGGKFFQCRKLLIATGVSDIMPPIKGFKACWGKSVLHCPYCHGYEEYNKFIGILGNSDSGFGLTQLLFNWSKRLTLFTNGKSKLSDKQTNQLIKNGIKIIETEVVEIKHKKGYLNSIKLKNSNSIAIDVVFASVRIKQHSQIAEELGVEIDEKNLLKCNDVGKTKIDDTFVAGDNSSEMKQVAIAHANGVKAGIAINKELVQEQFS